MNERNWKEDISIDPNICHGKACVKNIWVLVSVILDCLAESMSREILKNYSTLQEKHIKSALQYGAILAQEQVLPLRFQDSEI
ncbi:MAG: DUF433 domain-containing protein [Candidatus Lokiarchaeota archaeon]|nr:DUF433 domain-containing protein [Candidatus Lokiarchaeota archaeon]